MFTEAYPFASKALWKGQELRALCEVFDDVCVAPLHQMQRDPSLDLPEGVRILPPVFPIGVARRSIWGRILGLVNRRLPDHVARMEPARHMTDVRRFWQTVYQIEEVLQSPAWRQDVAPRLDGSTLYFFWGRGYAAVIPYLSRSQHAKTLVRLHRWDLYPDQNDGYIPFQRRIVESAAAVVPISRDGVDVLARLYPAQVDKLRCLRLGTEVNGLSTSSDDGVFRIVSCAYANPVKRLHLIAEALHGIDFPVRWTHLGDGPEMARVRQACEGLPAHIEVDLMGAVPPTKVASFYRDQSVDLFINVSASEGIPVSIMEAMAAGIPTLATNVGGSGEIVDGETGRLLAPDVTAEALAAAIASMRSMPEPARLAMRAACRQLVEREYDMARNARAVAQALLALG